MLRWIFLVASFFSSEASPEVCLMIQQLESRIVEFQRRDFSVPCVVDLSSTQLWFNRKEIRVASITITQEPLRGRLEILGTQVFYHPGEWVSGKDSFVIDFYLETREQQITVVVGIFPGTRERI